MPSPTHAWYRMLVGYAMGTALTWSLTAVPVLLSGCAPSRPAWLGAPPSSNWQAVGVAPIRDGDVGAAEELAAARARKALAARLETEIRGQLEHQVREASTDAGTTAAQRTQSELRAGTRATLTHTRVLDRFVDEGEQRVYVLVGIDVDALARDVRERYAPWLRRWSELELAAAGEGPIDDAAALLRQFVAVWRQRPAPDAATELLRRIAPDRAAGIIGAASEAELGQRWLEAFARRAAVVIEPQGEPRRGAELELRVRHRAPGLPLRWRIRPHVALAAPKQLPRGAFTVRVQRLLPARDGAFHLEARLPLPSALAGELEEPTLASLRLEVAGDPATLLVGGETDCLEANQLLTHLEQCPSLRDFRMRSLEQSSPELATRLRELGTSASRFRDSEAKFARAGADRAIWYRVRCDGPTAEEIDGYAFYKGSAAIDLFDLWPDGELERTHLETESAAASPERWRAAVVGSLAEHLCSALTGTEAP